jgi:hypothetical protein
MVNPNDSMGVEDNTDPMKPPKKGRKIKLISNGSIQFNIFIGNSLTLVCLP